MPLRSLPKTRAWSGITLGENKLLIRRVLPFLIYRQKPQSNIVRTPLVDLQYLVYHLSPVCSIRAFAKELDLSFWKLWEKIYGLDQTKITIEKIGKIQKLRYWDDTKKEFINFSGRLEDAVFLNIKLDDAVWWSYTPLSAVSSQNAPQSGSTLKKH